MFYILKTIQLTCIHVQALYLICVMLADWNDPRYWRYASDETVPPDSELENDLDVVGTQISEEYLASYVDLFITSKTIKIVKEEI